jgi:hypothetical protein
MAKLLSFVLLKLFPSTFPWFLLRSWFPLNTLGQGISFSLIPLPNSQRFSAERERYTVAVHLCSSDARAAPHMETAIFQLYLHNWHALHSAVRLITDLVRRTWKLKWPEQNSLHPLVDRVCSCNSLLIQRKIKTSNHPRTHFHRSIKLHTAPKERRNFNSRVNEFWECGLDLCFSGWGIVSGRCKRSNNLICHHCSYTNYVNVNILFPSSASISIMIISYSSTYFGFSISLSWRWTI